MRKYGIIPLLILLSGCDPEPVLLPDPAPVQESGHSGMFILCEGLFNQNNSTMSWFDFSTGRPESWSRNGATSYDCFEKANGRRLGDTACGMILYGSRLYIAVSESGTVEIVDPADCRSLTQISMPGAQPRALAAYGGSVYVCCFDGTVARIDTLEMKVTGTASVGRNPDGICAAGGKLYVSNSGGLDFSRPDSTVSVISLDTFTETARIAVHPNPGRICTDGTGVYVISRGLFDYSSNSYDSRLQRIDTGTDRIVETYDFPVLNMDIDGGRAWLYGYGDGRIRVLETATGLILDDCFIKDGTQVECPYGIKADAASGKVYICDAADYVTPGSVLCFNADGRLEYRLQGIGINPNSIVFHDGGVSAQERQGSTQEGLADRVFEYRPAPGQFVNTMPLFEEGDNDSTMAAKCLAALRGNGMVTLGGYGGYITIGLGHAIANRQGYDFEIDGNALKGSAEPAVVWVSADVNGNALPDDCWYQIAGSEYARSAQDCSISYFRPQSDDASVPWATADSSGMIPHNSFHAQAYYPKWYDSESVTFTGTLLPCNMALENGSWVMQAYEWGYADNLPNGSDGSRFDIDWAVRDDGTAAGLDSINFIRIQSAVIGSNAVTGEISAELTRILELE